MTVTWLTSLDCEFDKWEDNSILTRDMAQNWENNSYPKQCRFRQCVLYCTGIQGYYLLLLLHALHVASSNKQWKAHNLPSELKCPIHYHILQILVCTTPILPLWCSTLMFELSIILLNQSLLLLLYYVGKDGSAPTEHCPFRHVRMLRKPAKV